MAGKPRGVRTKQHTVKLSLDEDEFRALQALRVGAESNQAALRRLIREAIEARDPEWWASQDTVRIGLDEIERLVRQQRRDSQE